MPCRMFHITLTPTRQKPVFMGTYCSAFQGTRRGGGGERMERQMATSGTNPRHILLVKDASSNYERFFSLSHRLVTFLLAENMNCYFKLSCSNVLNLIKLARSKHNLKLQPQAFTQGKQHERKRLLLSGFSFFPLSMFTWSLSLQFNTRKHIYR